MGTWRIMGIEMCCDDTVSGATRIPMFSAWLECGIRWPFGWRLFEQSMEECHNITEVNKGDCVHPKLSDKHELWCLRPLCIIWILRLRSESPMPDTFNRVRKVSSEDALKQWEVWALYQRYLSQSLIVIGQVWEFVQSEISLLTTTRLQRMLYLIFFIPARRH